MLCSLNFSAVKWNIFRYFLYTFYGTSLNCRIVICQMQSKTRIFSSAMIISESTVAQNCQLCFHIWIWFGFCWYLIQFHVTTLAYMRLQDWRKMRPVSEAIIYQRWQKQNTRPVCSFLIRLQQAWNKVLICKFTYIMAIWEMSNIFILRDVR